MGLTVYRMCLNKSVQGDRFTEFRNNAAMDLASKGVSLHSYRSTLERLHDAKTAGYPRTGMPLR